MLAGHGRYGVQFQLNVFDLSIGLSYSSHISYDNAYKLVAKRNNSVDCNLLTSDEKYYTL